MSDSIRDMADTELAKMWLGYGFGHEQVEEEVERRWPRLAGWKAAADHLSRAHWDRWHAEQERQGAFDLSVLGPDDSDPGAVALMAEYRKSVQRVADGDPGSSADEDSGLFL
jgi:hypothetical protein